MKNGGRRFVLSTAVRRAGVQGPATTNPIIADTVVALSRFADAGGKREPLQIKLRCRSMLPAMFGVKPATFLRAENVVVCLRLRFPFPIRLFLGEFIELSFSV